MAMSSVTFTHFLKTQLLMALLSGLALGIALCVALLFVGSVTGEVALDIQLASADGFWGLLLLPLLLGVLCYLSRPCPMRFCCLRINGDTGKPRQINPRTVFLAREVNSPV